MFDDLGQGWPLIWKNLENLKMSKNCCSFQEISGNWPKVARKCHRKSCSRENLSVKLLSSLSALLHCLLLNRLFWASCVCHSLSDFVSYYIAVNNFVKHGLAQHSVLVASNTRPSDFLFASRCADTRIGRVIAEYCCVITPVRTEF